MAVRPTTTVPSSSVRYEAVPDDASIDSADRVGWPYVLSAPTPMSPTRDASCRYSSGSWSAEP
ncbi:hypothetical protein EDF28_2183 [Curtobacterium sp. PhB137]|nr:hypothetical protein EDF28_2183 [Curtobacterium sp. PhB137]